MKTARQVALEALKAMLAPQWSMVTFGAMLSDPGDAGHDLRRMAGKLEAAIEADRSAQEKAVAPS